MTIVASEASAPARKLNLAALAPLAAMACALLGFAGADPRMISAGNLLNILDQSAYLLIFAVAQTIVLITRGFDLALGGTVSATSVIVALAMTNAGFSGWSAVALGLAAGVGFGALVGLFNGLAVAGLKVNPFIATLGSYNICVGIATTVSGGRPVIGLPPEFGELLYGGRLFGVPTPLLIASGIVVLCAALLRNTTFGRSLYLIGVNERAAYVAGLPTRRILVAAYMLSAALTAIGAMMLTARTGSGEPSLGGTLTLQAIAAAIIGGVSLSGGRGGAGSAVFGALLVTILSNGMNLAQINGYYQMIALGAVLIASVALDRSRSSSR